MRKLIRPTVLALSMVFAASAPLALHAQSDKRDNAEKAGDATEKALEKAGDGAEKGLDATGKGIGAVVEHTTRGAVKTGKAVANFFDDDVDKDENEDNVKAVQQALETRGYYNGPIDGIVGSKTRSGVREFQQDENLPATGRINAATLNKLGVK